jgi:hypothetical protein
VHADTIGASDVAGHNERAKQVGIRSTGIDIRASEIMTWVFLAEPAARGLCLCEAGSYCFSVSRHANSDIRLARRCSGGDEPWEATMRWPKRGFTLFVKRGATAITLSRGFPTREAALAAAIRMAATRPVGSAGMAIRCEVTGTVWLVGELVGAAVAAEAPSLLVAVGAGVGEE